MDSNWYSKIEPTIITRLQYYLRGSPLFENLVCTTTTQNLVEDEETVRGNFPTLYLQVRNAETGQDLDNTEVNAVNCTARITVYCNKSKSDCEDIADAALAVMKTMRFNAPELPLVTEYKNIFLASMTCRRVIGAGDKSIID